MGTDAGRAHRRRRASRVPGLGATCGRRGGHRRRPRARDEQRRLRRVRSRGARGGRGRLHVPARRRAPARPVLALAAGGAARTVAAVRADPPRAPTCSAPPAIARPGDLRAAHRHLQRRGHLRRRRSRISPELARARRHRDRDRCRSPSSPARAAGATTASTSPPRSPPTAAPTAFAALVDAAHERGPRGDPRRRLQPPRRVRGRARWRRSGPYFTDKYETPWGKAINYDDADCDPVREWVLPERRGLDPRLRDRRAAPRRDPRDLRLQRRAHRRRASPPRPRGQPAGAGDRRVRAQRPAR